MARTTDQTLAREALDALRNCKSVKLSVRGGRTVQVPDSALDSILATLEAVADGSTVEVVRTEAEVSTQQAARILNVSRPTAVRLFDTGEIASHKIGSHRRARLKDVVEYRDAEAARRRAALDEMVRDAEDMGLYDVEPLPFRR
jgi:excisionase family DNA binding protein